MAKPIMKTGIARDERHVRWGYHKSPDDETLMRYHFVVVDDKHRREQMDELVAQLNFTGSAVPIRQDVTGRVGQSKMHFLFETFDSQTAPGMVNPGKLGKPVKFDRELYERKGTDGIEVYVTNQYA